MKKILPLLLLFITLGASAQDGLTDITPKGYDWNKLTSYKFVGNTDTSTPWNAPVAWFASTGKTLYNEGVIMGNGGQVSKNIEMLNKSTTILDLGGTTGKVLCIARKGSGLAEALKPYVGDVTVNEVSNDLGYYHLYIYTDPKNTPTNLNTSQMDMRVRIVLNVFRKSLTDNDGVVKVYAMDDQNNVHPTDDNLTKNILVSSAEFAKTYNEDEGTKETEGDIEGMADDNGNYTWNPERWMVYEFDVRCPDPDNDGTQYAPLHLKLEAPGVPNSAILIKEIKVFKKDAGTNTIMKDRPRKWKYFTLSKPTSGIENLNADKDVAFYSIQGKTITFATDATVYTTQGHIICKATKGTPVVLKSGLYLAKIKGKNVKFIIR